jgi:hypothetical protein
MGGFYVGECPRISPFLKNNGHSPMHNPFIIKHFHVDTS